ncbi:hypothetical protein FIU89_11235 [Roseovarius sp. THAF27]|uniref:hypothetical protein n=1 Tax=Roseovarius sp. THAF27 TaxID=2587850 RepID=UPI0012690E3B|nr:hypothetical protein [Roseovarius sp. THAF27]QFT81183.1 hypothetical protein FIU89_11235 [Roseovarius sp. THAF27]
MIPASGIDLSACEDPACTAVHLILTDDDGVEFAVASLEPDQARKLAVQLNAWADRSEASALREAGRLT